jgi:hypothetical protein
VTADPKTIPPLTVTEENPPSPTPGNHFGSEVRTRVAKTGSSWHIWLLRLRALLLVTVCATFGVLLLILPWTPKWTDNPLLLSYPALREFVSSGFFRGLSSGLGVLDLWLGFWEAVHYHETPSS